MNTGQLGGTVQPAAAESLSDRMTSITAGLDSTLDTADQLMTVPTNTELTDGTPQLGNLTPVEIINLQSMVDDFKYVRKTLRENTDNGRRVLNAVTLEILSNDTDKSYALVTAFAELNKAVADNMKLYVNAYKEISNVLLNVNKLNSQSRNTKPGAPGNTPTAALATLNLIKQL